MSFENLLGLVRESGKCKIGVVGAAAEEVLLASRRVVDEGIAQPILIGNVNRMQRLASDHEINLDGLELLNVSDDEAGARMAADLVRGGEVEALMKGRIPTWILMKEGLSRGLRNDNTLLSHVTLIEVPRFNRPLLVTDSALTPYPSFDQRVAITRNAVWVMRRLGVEEPMVAMLSAAEEVNVKIPASVEARRMQEMNQPGGELEDCGHIAGPLDLGCALHEETAEIKGVKGPVAGNADILVAPDIVSANVLSKALIYLAQGEVAACVVGGTVPIGMVSRASPARDKYHAMLLALALR